MQLERGMKMKNSIFLALDFPTWEETNDFLEKNKLAGVPVKVGMELFYREGPIVIERLRANGHPIFLDLKLHDIPTTIYKAMRNLASLDVTFVNVHGFGGSKMIEAAKQGLEDGSVNGNIPKLLVVTLLTSMDQEVLTNELQVNQPLSEMVVDLSALGKEAGADGVVCSAQEVTKMKQQLGNDFLAVTPGIRLAATSTDDQKRVATPKVAKQAGADALVIGRSITQATNPQAMYNKAIEEWKHVSR